MKSSIFRTLLVLGLLAVRLSSFAMNLAPDCISLQSGGGMGIATVGTGWSYGKNKRFETELFVGLIPKYDSSQAKAIITIKENLVPWNMALKERLFLEPLTVSIYFTSILNNKFWAKQPDRYPSGYYGLPTKIRTNIALGQRLSYVPRKKLSFTESITAYYELSTCDIYVASAFGNKYIKPYNSLQICIGLKLNLIL